MIPGEKGYDKRSYEKEKISLSYKNKIEEAKESQLKAAEVKRKKVEAEEAQKTMETINANKPQNTGTVHPTVRKNVDRSKNPLPKLATMTYEALVNLFKKKIDK